MMDIILRLLPGVQLGVEMGMGIIIMDMVRMVE